MKKTLIFSGIIAVLLFGAWRFFLSDYWHSLKPAIGPAPKDITRYLPEDTLPPEAVIETDLPLTLPRGFAVSLFAKNLAGARIMARDHEGNFWVSRTSRGIVTKLVVRDGKASQSLDVFRGLKKPHGIAFDPKDAEVLYIAEEHRVSKFSATAGKFLEKIMDLPYGDGHFTRTIKFGPSSVPLASGTTAGKPDGRLYISIGSSCNVCIETDERRASIITYDPGSKKTEIFARGLRNAVFFTWDYVFGKMFATEMGRDWLGDDLPPDEINLVEQGKNYGWPVCYGKNIHDTDFDKNTYIRNPCTEPFETPSFIDIPAHSAPLGLAFIPEEGWPEDYWYDLVVAYHGSWNKTEPTGYKVVRLKFNAKGEYEGSEDFTTGWLVAEGALGRPVDIIIEPGGIMFISDDKAGVIYKVRVQ